MCDQKNKRIVMHIVTKKKMKIPQWQQQINSDKRKINMAKEGMEYTESGSLSKVGR